MTCSSCGHANRDSAKFCEECGARLAPPAREPDAYTPKHLVDKILTSRSALEGERKQVTVLFADMKGSTELTARLDPEEWHAVMDRFLTILTDGVHHFEGTVNQYTGDGIMALFGAPIAHEDHAQRACFAALRLRDELRQHADALRIERGLSFSVRMGLHSGEVVVGKIGDDLRMDYTARGHTVHLASRMEQIAEPGRIYLSDATSRLVEGYFQLRDLGSTSVKGLRKPIKVSELVGAGELQTRFDLSRARGLTPFIGRDREMARLEAALGRARAGRAQIVGVVAEAGSGKSRLCWEFANRCRDREIRVYSVTCPPYGKSIPLSLYRSLLRAFFEVSESDSDELARNKVAGRMARQDPDLASCIPFVLDLLGLAEPGSEAPALDSDARERELLHVGERLLASRRDGLIVEIADDLHWIDRASEGAHFEIQRLLHETPHLTILNYRPEHRPLEADHPNFEELRLEPLSAEATAELLAELLGPDASGRGLEERIQARAAGNPFFVEEIVRRLADSGHLEGTRGAYRLARAVESIDVPESVRAVLAARIDKLHDKAKRTLQAGAVLGKSFQSSRLADALGRPTRELEETLHALASSEFVALEAAYPDEVWAFKHPLTQEVAYDTLLRATRQRIHGAVARALAADEPTDPEALSLLAYHWAGANKPLEAARCHRLASPEYADPNAAYDHALRVRELLTASRKTNEARRLRLWALSRILGWGRFRDASLDQVKEILGEARGLVRDPADRTELANLLSGAAGVAHMSSDYALARSLAEEAVSLADRGDDLIVQLSARLRLAESYGDLEPLADQLRVIDEGIAFGREQLPDEPGPPHGMLATLVLWRGSALALQGRADVAERHYAEGDQRMALFPGGSMRTIAVEKLRAELEAQRGNGAAALRHATRLLEAADQVGTRYHIADAWGVLGKVLLTDDRWRESAQAVERAHAEAASTPARPRMRAALLAVLSAAHLGLGDRERALTAAQQAVEWAEQTGSAIRGIDCQLALANALLAASGRRARAKIQRALARAEELIESSGARARTPQVHLARAQLAELLGKTKDRERELREAHRLFMETGATGHAERTARQLAGHEPMVKRA